MEVPKLMLKDADQVLRIIYNALNEERETLTLDMIEDLLKMYMQEHQSEAD